MPNYAVSAGRFQGEEGARLNNALDEIVLIINALSLVDTLASRTPLPHIDHIQYYASDTKQSFIGVAGAWQNMGPRRGSDTIANSATTKAVTLTPNEPDASYGVYVNLGYDNGGVWVTSKATTGFTVNVKTAAAGGNGGFRWILVRD